MSEPSQSPQGSSEKSDSLRSLAFKGVIGVITLVGTTAIPLIVQRALQDTAVSPPPTVPAQIVPAQVQSATPVQPEAVPVPESDSKQEKPRNKDRKSND